MSNIEFNEFPQKSQLQGEAIPGNYDFYDPASMAYNQNMLIISEADLDHPLRLLDLETKSYEILKMQKGRGPSGITDCGGLKPYKDYFLGLSLMAQEILTINPAARSDKDIQLLQRHNIRNVTGNFSTVDHFFAGSDGFYFSGNFTEGRIIRYDSLNNETQRIGRVPSERYPKGVYNYAHIGALVASSEVDRIALGHSYTDVIEIYSEAGKRLRKVKGPIGEPLEIVTKSKTIAGLTDNNYFGYKELFNYRNKIWGVFCGSKFNEEYAYEADKLVVFSWQGKPLKKYQLDRHLLVTALDKENDYLYGISAEPKIELVRYDLD